MHQGLSICAVLIYFWLKFCYSLFWVKLPHTSLCPHGDCLGATLLWYGELQLGQMSFGPLPFPAQESTLRSYIERVHLDAGVSCAWQTYDVASRVCFTLYLPRKCYTDKTQYVDRHIGQPMHPRCWSLQYLLTNQNFYTSMEVGSWWFKCCI